MDRAESSRSEYLLCEEEVVQDKTVYLSAPALQIILKLSSMKQHISHIFCELEIRVWFGFSGSVSLIQLQPRCQPRWSPLQA